MRKTGKKSKKRAVLVFIALFIIISIVVGYVITCVEMNKNFGRGDYPDGKGYFRYFLFMLGRKKPFRSKLGL